MNSDDINIFLAPDPRKYKTPTWTKSKEVQCKNTFTIYIVNVNKTENYLMSVSDTKSATSRTSTFTLTISLVNLKKKKFHKEH